MTDKTLTRRQTQFLRHYHFIGWTPARLAARLRMRLETVCAALGVAVPLEPPKPTTAELAADIAGKAARLAEALQPAPAEVVESVPAPVDPPPLEPPPPLAALEPGSLRPGRHVINGVITIIADPRHGLRVL